MYSLIVQVHETASAPGSYYPNSRNFPQDSMESKESYKYAQLQVRTAISKAEFILKS